MYTLGIDFGTLSGRALLVDTELSGLIVGMTLGTAADAMGRLKDEVVTPIAEHKAVYDQLYAEYKTLYDYFGRGSNDAMKRLKRIRNAARGEA